MTRLTCESYTSFGNLVTYGYEFKREGEDDVVFDLVLGQADLNRDADGEGRRLAEEAEAAFAKWADFAQALTAVPVPEGMAPFALQVLR